MNENESFEPMFMRLPCQFLKKSETLSPGMAGEASSALSPKMPVRIESLENVPAAHKIPVMPDLDLHGYIVSNGENRLPNCPLHPADAQESGESPRVKMLPLEDMAFRGLPYNPNDYHAVRYHLEDIHWSAWGTITWKNGFRRISGPDAEKARKADFRTLVDKTRSYFGLRGRDLFYYHATEYGRSGENHLHFLIWNKKPNRVPHFILAATMQHFWNNDFVICNGHAKSGGAGLADVQPYDRTIPNPAARYCFKREYDKYGNEQERYDGMSSNLSKYILSRTAESLPKLEKEMHNHEGNCKANDVRQELSQEFGVAESCNDYRGKEQTESICCPR